MEEWSYNSMHSKPRR